MIRNLLRRLSMSAVPSPVVDASHDDQAYSEAAMDNAIVDSGRTIDQLCRSAARGGRANEMLREGIDRLKVSGADPIEMIARASRVQTK